MKVAVEVSKITCPLWKNTFMESSKPNIAKHESVKSPLYNHHELIESHFISFAFVQQLLNAFLPYLCRSLSKMNLNPHRKENKLDMAEHDIGKNRPRTL